MKKLVFVLSAVLACGFTILACSSDKKSKKGGASSITVEVTPATIGQIDLSSPTHTLTAIVKNNGVIQANAAVSWVVKPSTAAGICSPTQGVSTVFAADPSYIGQGSIVASYNGTESATVQFSINEAMVVINHIDLTVSTDTVANSGSVTLTAVAKDSSNIDIPTQPALNWSVSPTTLGSLSSTTGASVTFTANSTGNGTVTITVTDPISGKFVTKTINVGTTSVPSTLTFVLGSFTTEGGLYDIHGWGGETSNGWEVPATWPLMAGHDDVTRGIFQMTWKAGWGGPTPVRLEALDASQYTKLVFYARVPSGTGDIVVRALGTDAGTSTTFEQRGFSLTTTWKKCEIPIPVDRTGVKGIMCFVLAANEYSVEGKTTPVLPYTFYVDNVYYE